ncbi:MOSC domain-containing protein [Bryocella elongata]|uniref:MOSC domain-containing protein n=1 Tax=Bryocella elongata TaxID=863522 RepID=UPI001F1F6BAD|nr:MOSC domain-containing protein [Bryocella elongata]
MAVSRAAAHGFSKQTQASILLIEGEGVEGDAHRGVRVQHLYQQRRDPTQPNLCQVHLFAAEMLEELQGAGFDVGAGEIGENVLTSGIDLLTLPTHTRLRIGDEVIVEVTGLRTPCSQIDGYRNGLQAHLWGARDAAGKRSRRAGVMAVVIAGGQIFPADRIQAELPAEPHIPLRPV